MAEKKEKKEDVVKETAQVEVSLEKVGVDVSRNAIAFLDEVKISAVGDENRQKLSVYVQTIHFLEMIASGNYIVTEAKPEEEKKKK